VNIFVNKYRVIKFYKIPPWPVNIDNRYYTTYRAIIDNFDRCCKDKDVLFIDNTYLDGPEVVTRVAEYRRSIIFNLLDPPYTWHYLQELLKKKIIFWLGPTHLT